MKQYNDRILITGGSGYGKINTLINLIKNKMIMINDKFIYVLKIQK